MNIDGSRRLFVVAAVLGALAVFTAAFFVALAVRSVVADPSGPVPNPGHAWTEIQGHGDDADACYVDTENNQAFELRVNGSRALRLEPDPNSPNLIGGYSGNSVTGGAVGATIGGGGADGWSNLVSDDYGTVGGGGNNRAGDAAGDPDDAPYNTVSGGEGNVASASSYQDRWWGHATVGGGYGNTASGDWGTVGGGGGNTAGAGSTVAGGAYNTASGTNATVGGGSNNTASQWAATVGGGDTNTASADNATVGGGQSNTADAYAATIAGGAQSDLADPNTRNRVTDDYGTIGGGGNNQAGDGDDGDPSDATYASVGGGYGNEASGYAATVAGGEDNTASGDYSFAAGRRAKASSQGCFVWGDSTDGDIVCGKADRFMIRASGGVYMLTSGDHSTGAYLAGGSGTWADLSDRNLKENFTPVDGQEVLASLAEVPVSTWNYKAQDASIRHMGPVAQDLYAAFGLGEDERYITTVDADGVALAALQGLYELVQEQGARIDALEARVAVLEGDVGLDEGSTGLLSSVMPAGWLLLGGLVLGGLVLVQRRSAGGRA